jgi:hypothetical protein
MAHFGVYCSVPRSVIGVRMIVVDHANCVGCDWTDSDNIWNKIILYSCQQHCFQQVEFAV